MRDPDDAWFDSLAGRSGAGTDRHAPTAPSSREAAALRSALRSAAADPPVDVPVTDPRREAALIARARAAGLGLPAIPARRAATRGWPLWLAAASLACVFVGVTLRMDGRSGGPPVTRGGGSQVIRIESADPPRLKQQLLRELGAAGVQATGYRILGREGLDADLPTPLPDAVREVLERHGIEPPNGAVLQVEIEPVPTP